MRQRLSKRPVVQSCGRKWACYRSQPTPSRVCRALCRWGVNWRLRGGFPLNFRPLCWADSCAIRGLKTGGNLPGPGAKFQGEVQTTGAKPQALASSSRESPFHLKIWTPRVPLQANTLVRGACLLLLPLPLGRISLLRRRGWLPAQECIPEAPGRSGEQA
jgi:hypothetical protein